MTEFRITNEHRPNEVGNVIDVLRRPRLWIPTGEDYPDHETWLQKTEAQIGDNRKRALLAYHNAEPVGTVVYQRHEDHPDVLEVRNISIAPESQGRYLGSFLLRNTEIEGGSNDFPGVTKIMVDTKITNTDMIAFLLGHGYAVEGIVDLYGLGTGLDAVLTKPLIAK
jgi:ribosomal protein S18 acetylase RimI-like enzyme